MAAPTSSQGTDRLHGYRQALEDHFCITVTDCSGRILEANKRFCEVVGYSEAELIGQPYELLSSGQHAPESLEDMWRIVHAGKTWRGEFCDRAKNGADVWFESIVIPRFNRHGEIEQFITISTDITPIRQQAQTLQAMLDNFPGGIALIDREARVAANNRLYRTLLDMPDELFSGGAPKLEALVRFRAERGDYGTALPIEETVANRLKFLLSPDPTSQERNENTGKVLEISSIPIPRGPAPSHFRRYNRAPSRRARAQARSFHADRLYQTRAGRCRHVRYANAIRGTHRSLAARLQYS